MGGGSDTNRIKKAYNRERFINQQSTTTYGSLESMEVQLAHEEKFRTVERRLDEGEARMDEHDKFYAAQKGLL